MACRCACRGNWGALFPVVSSGISTDRHLLLLLVILLLCFPPIYAYCSAKLAKDSIRDRFWPVLPSLPPSSHRNTKTNQQKWPTSLSPQPTSARTRTMRAATGSLSKTAFTMSAVRSFPLSPPISLAHGRERVQQKKERRTAQLTRAQLRKPSRVPRRASRRLQDPEALRRQERDQGFLEVPRRERTGEVRRQIQDWHRQGGAEAVKGNI